MAAIARALDRVRGIQLDAEPLKTLAIFSGAGLAASLLLASYGVDLCAGLL
jgi:hypothetical protein